MTSTRIDSLPRIEVELWHQLELAARQPEHEWHRLALATVEGTEAQVRTVLLRDVDEAARELTFFTDSRAPKVAQLRAQPVGALMCWSGRLSWQLRLRVRMAVDTSGLQVSSRWARLRLTKAAQDYMAPLPPGSPIAPRTEPKRESRENFAVVTATVLSLDWLELHPDGHRRARFAPGAAQWLQP